MVGCWDSGCIPASEPGLVVGYAENSHSFETLSGDLLSSVPKTAQKQASRTFRKSPRHFLVNWLSSVDLGVGKVQM